MSRFRRVPTALAVGLCLCLAVSLATPAAGTDRNDTRHAEQDSAGVYLVEDTDTPALRTRIADLGVDVLTADDTSMTVVADADQLAGLRAVGRPLTFLADREAYFGGAPEDVPDGPSINAFPNGYQDYHDFAELTSALQQAAAEHSDLATLSTIGTSAQGRNLWLMSITRAPAGSPEVLFTCQQHAREHLTREMCLRIVNRFTDSYGSDPAVTQLVNSRIIRVIPSVNPDGAEYDHATGTFRGWRKNRQGQGTDLNRNWGHQWGCCGGSSGSPSSDTYRGTSAFSAIETQRVRDYVASRVVGGDQRITAHIDFHTYSELVLWPYGYTYSDTGPGLSAQDAAAFRTLGTQMARTNGYTPQQSSDLYITDGSINDWMWAAHGIYSYTFEMYPRGGGLNGFYPIDDVIDRETARNDAAVDLLLSYADCVPRVIGASCG
ncbi:hypothetical protein FHR81_000832 [Actinoalloteichus hoggarensis]|uniref:Zinc carboxypeptidase n=1 Tax=Actinoalloteichus hoggarensis TaxID=1470176 RepID=A0A221W1R3_9PSEU|nr:M14 family metallopeptidase [Actinoalloteichus hoggarensis]ASO19491.1 Zinc carboxypeptidase precursor [Actinoalloteichus hoggarensis]MBB5919803.1 hypothetical protein [Actinoalloteichus hoggarensis]